MLASSFRKLLTRKRSAAPARRRAASFTPRLEEFEARLVLSVSALQQDLQAHLATIQGHSGNDVITLTDPG